MKTIKLILVILASILLGLGIFSLPPFAFASISLPVASAAAVTTGSTGSLLAGFNVPSGTTLSFSPGSTLSFSPGSILTLSGLNLNAAYTVGTLPAANTVSHSPMVWVTDSTTSLSGATIGTTPTGSGSYSVPVASNGAAWIIP